MRQAFQRAIDDALLHCRGAKQGAIYNVFDAFDWTIEDDEAVYAAQKAGFKQGWVYYHTGDRRQQSRDTHLQVEVEKEQERRMRAEQRAQQAQQASSQQQTRYAQAEAQRNANRRQQDLEDALRMQFEWLFRAGMNGAQREAFQANRADASGCPGYIEPMVRRFGLTWPFTAAELKRVYRKKCMETHPDRGGSAEAFHQVQKDNQELERYAQGGT